MQFLGPLPGSPERVMADLCRGTERGIPTSDWERRVAKMATAPCLFHRPEGTELLRKARVERGPDFAKIFGAEIDRYSKQSNIIVSFPVVNLQNWQGGNFGVDAQILATMPCGPNRMHILGRTGRDSVIIIENYNYERGKGDLYEFAELWGNIGRVYLFDLGRKFTRDGTHIGEVIKACFNRDVKLKELSDLLEERGYKVATKDVKQPELGAVERRSYTEIWRYEGRGFVRFDGPGSSKFQTLPWGDEWEDSIVKAGEYVMAEKVA